MGSKAFIPHAFPGDVCLNFSKWFFTKVAQGIVNSFIAQSLIAGGGEYQCLSFPNKTKSFSSWCQNYGASLNRDFEQVTGLDGEFVTDVFRKNKSSGIINRHQQLFHGVENTIPKF